MDDSCAVCAESLEWVAYGSCGHREVCSTCVARLRFVMNDRRCCLCKVESATVYVTKALGDYTRMINDFSVLPSDASEGRVGSYWYHEDTQSFFDDVDHYKMIKAMCKLSCSICDKHGEERGNEITKSRNKFKNIEQLKSHLYHRHRMLMCNLCLNGRKIFICEQKLYSRAQLNQHINSGDSEVDGSESERGGFTGHPMCEFCRNPFYGDNELYLHMSTEHYTCHICQRQHPGQYEYYKNYDDLEIHFRQEHFLCENEACLAKKFVVFPSESEMKRHNAIEHGGHMSRSKRNAALQIPTSFRYRRSNEQDRRRGRGRGSNPEPFEDQLSLAIQASFETVNADYSVDGTTSISRPEDNRETGETDSGINLLETLTIAADAEPSSRYLQALSQTSSNTRLDESFFPPLSGTSSSSKQSSNNTEGQEGNTMAARLRRRNKGTVAVINSSKNRTWGNHGLSSSGSSSDVCSAFPVLVSSSSASTSLSKQPGLQSSSSISSQAAWLRNASEKTTSSSRNSSDTARLPYSKSSIDLGGGGSSKSSMTNKPLGVESHQMPEVSSESLLNGDDVQSANKSLVERIRSGLGHDGEKFLAFKDISSEYRQGVIGTGEYLAYVEQFGLSHLLLELARLCPDAQKQRALVKAYNAFLQKNGPHENGASIIARVKENKGSSKDKGKHVAAVENNGAKASLADNIINTVRKLQANQNASDDVEVLSKDGYRTGCGKSRALSLAEKPQTSSVDQQSADSGGSIEALSIGGGRNNTKQRKKMSKFNRLRLGDAAASAPSPEHSPAESSAPSDSLPVRGVWRNGGGQRLVSMTQRGLTR